MHMWTTLVWWPQFDHWPVRRYPRWQRSQQRFQSPVQATCHSELCGAGGLVQRRPFVSLIFACPFSIWSIKFPKSLAKLQISRCQLQLLTMNCFFLTEGGGNHPFARPWCLPSWSFPGSLMQIGWQVATLPVMLTLAILVVTPMARYKFILFYSFNPTICVFFFRFGAPDLLVDQNSLCFWTRFRFTTRIPMHGTAVAHPQAVSLGFRSFGDCEAFHRKSGAKSWNEKRFFSRRGRCGRWNSLSVKIYQRWSEK